MTRRICVEASPAVQQQAGIGRYALNLIRALLSAQPDGDYAIGYNLSGSATLPEPLGSVPTSVPVLPSFLYRYPVPCLTTPMSFPTPFHNLMH